MSFNAADHREVLDATAMPNMVNDARTLSQKVALLKQRYKSSGAVKKAEQKFQAVYEEELKKLEQQLGGILSDEAKREIYDRLVVEPMKEIHADNKRYQDARTQMETLVQARIDEVKSEFLTNVLCKFAENFDYSRVEDFIDDLKNLKREIKIEGDTHIIDVRSFSDEELRPLLDLVDKKMYAYNNLVFEACSPEQKALIQSGQAIVIDGKFVRKMNPIIFSGTHGDEVSPVIEFTEAAKKISKEGLRLAIQRSDMHIETMVNPVALKRRKRTGASGIDINQLTPTGSYEQARKAQVMEAIPKFDNPYIIDFHNCRGKSKPYAYVSNMNQRNIDMAKELGLEKLIICDPKIADNTVLSDAIQHTKGDGMVIETSAQDTEQIAMRIAIKLLHLGGILGSGVYRSSIALQAATKTKLPMRNQSLKIFGFQLPEIDSPESIPNDGHCYQVIDGAVIKIVRFRETENGLVEEPLSTEDKKSFNDMS